MTEQATPVEKAQEGRPEGERLEELKRKHGTIHEVEIDGLYALVRKPRLHDLERAMRASKKPGAKELDFNRNIVENCLVYIDPGFRNDDERELALLTTVGEIASIREANVRKL